jgi:hypothetical protein
MQQGCNGRARCLSVAVLVAGALAFGSAQRASAQCCACLGCTQSGFCVDDVADPIACARLCDAAGCPNLAYENNDTCAGGCDGQADLPTATPTNTPGGPTETPTNTPIPVATATASETATASATQTPTGGVPPPLNLHVTVGTAVGQPGSVVGFAVSGEVDGQLQFIRVCVQFDPMTPIQATGDGKPDCTPANFVGSSTIFFQPDICVPGASCTSVCAALTGMPPVSGTLFTCRVAIEPNAPPATYPLPCSADGVANSIPAVSTCAEGSVVVETHLPGDCNGDGQVTINELIIGVNIALGIAPISDCPAFDTNGDGQVSIDELIAAVNVALSQ